MSSIDTVERLEPIESFAGSMMESDPDGRYVSFEDLVAVVAKYKKDAERYRWLRVRINNRDYGGGIGNRFADAALDASIDRVIETREKWTL